MPLISVLERGRQVDPWLDNPAYMRSSRPVKKPHLNKMTTTIIKWLSCLRNDIPV